MQTIAERMGQRQYPGHLGIEIETETTNPYQVPNIPGWKCINDGSLRDFGKEYITNGPVEIDKLDKSLKNWKDGLGEIHNRFRRDSISTSVHVHANVQDHTALQALNFYLCGVLVENVMSHFAGPDRIGNLFCLRTIDAEDHYNTIRKGVVQASDDLGLLRAFNTTNYKYSNINTIPITEKGSLEFRIMRGTVDTDEINIWASSVRGVQEFAKQFDNPVAIVRAMKDLGVDGLLQKVFGDNLNHFKYQNYEKDVLKNFIYVADMATCRKDWDIKAGEQTKPKKRVPEVGINWEALRGGEQPAAVPEPVIQWDEDFEEEDM